MKWKRTICVVLIYSYRQDFNIQTPRLITTSVTYILITNILRQVAHVQRCGEQRTLNSNKTLRSYCNIIHIGEGMSCPHYDYKSIDRDTQPCLPHMLIWLPSRKSALLFLTLCRTVAVSLSVQRWCFMHCKITSNKKVFHLHLLVLAFFRMKLTCQCLILL